MKEENKNDNEVSVEELHRKLMEDHEWLAEHIEELTEKYPGKIVAIDNGQLVGVGDDYGEVCRSYIESKAKIMPLVMQLPHPDDPQEYFI